MNTNQGRKPRRCILTASLDPQVFDLFAARTRNMNRSRVLEALVAHWLAVVVPEMQGVAQVRREAVRAPEETND